MPFVSLAGNVEAGSVVMRAAADNSANMSTRRDMLKEMLGAGAAIHC